MKPLESGELRRFLAELGASEIRQDSVIRYLGALGFLALALAIRLILDPWLGNALSHASIFAAIVLATWYCGTGPAVAIAILAYPLAEYLILDHPYTGPSLLYLANSVGLYLAVVAVIIFFVASFRRERDELKQTQGKLKESEQRIRASFDNAALGIVEADPEDRFVAVNERMCRILGYSREELLKKTVVDVTAPEERAKTRKLLDQLHEGKCERFDYEKRFLRRDGLSVWLHITASAIRDEAGRFLYSIGTYEDINERKHAEEIVSLLSHAIQSTPNALVLTDRTGSILWANPASTRLTGYALEELLNQNPRMLKSGVQPKPFYEHLWSTILKGDAWQGELVNRRKDGSLYHEEMTITPVRAAGEEVTHFVCVKEDITERKRVEESLRAATASAERAKAVAEEATQAKDRFLAVLSHELRTPLTPVLAAVQLMQRRAKLPEDMRNPLEIIRRNVQLEARLIEDLLDLTRIVQGKLVLDRKPMNIGTAIERAVDISRPDINARKLHFGVELEDSVLLVNGDVSRLQQVVWNLLTNAVKFTPDGGCVGIRCRRENDCAVIEVSDSGMGIEAKAIGRIFDAFEQGGAAVTRQFGGLGLGLAIAKRLVEMHVGTITAHSAGKTQGSMFRVSLPLCSAELSSEAEKPPAVPAGVSRRILLVEDNGDTALMMKMLLETFGYEVESAGDVAQALDAIETGTFDLLISDLGLPDRSGLELMAEIRRRGNGLKGIALSGYGREEDVRRSEQAGFSMHLTKPVDADALIETVARVI